MKKLFYILLIITCLNAKAQETPKIVNNLKTLVISLTDFRKKACIEKLYLQTDKPYYTLGDTIWFKSYLLNADFLTPSTQSGLLYIELDNSNNQMVKRIMVPVVSGISFGDIALNELEIPEGSYTLRAYTNWMRNFGEDYIFKKNIYISALSGSTLVKASFKLDSLAGKNKVETNLTFTNLNKDPIRLKDMQLKIMNNGHNLFKDKAITGMDGSTQFNFDLADKTQLKNLSIIANQTGKGITDTAKLTIPVTINRPENMDVQFMPESGNLVAGILTKVGFKAISEDGKGTEITGKIVNSKNQTITAIKTLHKGMGSFELTPEANESYMAVINLPNKTTKNYALPKVNPEGTALRITPKGKDSLEITLTATATAINNYYLIGQSRGVVCYAATISFKEQTIKKSITNDLFPTGITRFTLLNQSNQPLNERIVYIAHHDNLKITVNTNKSNYITRDSVALNIEVNDKDNSPVHGIFSLAVTDDNQVKPDSIGSNIINDLLFTSDLKGTIEEPGWYFENDNKTKQHPDSYRDDNKTIALDNLLLTQGWVGYDWKQVFGPAITPQFSVEKEFTIQGKLTNVLNKPLKKAGVTLMQKQPLIILDTITNDEGNFVFKSKYLLPTDSTYYLIEAKKKDGENKTFNVGVEVNEPPFPQFTATKEQFLPWYFNSDTTLLNNVDTKIKQVNTVANSKGEGHMLKEVVIKGLKIIPESHNLNGPGGADVTLDEKDMNKEKNNTLFEALQHRFKDFHKITRFGITRYFLDYHGNEIADIVMNGVFISYFHLPQDLFMEGLKATDIKGIEVMITGKYASTYPHNITWLKIIPPWAPGQVYLEITTYVGVGASFNNSGWKDVYRPVTGLSSSKEFYRPRYTIDNKSVAFGTDLRSTIHWQPNVITNKDGKATVSFFSADKPADYTVIMEGTDLNGNLGYERQQIKVVSTAAGK